MLRVRPYFYVLCCAVALSACAGSNNGPDSNQSPVLQPVPSDQHFSDNPFMDDPTPIDPSRENTSENNQSTDEGCEHRFRVNLLVAGVGDRPDWHGEGRLRLNTCVSPDASDDGEMRVRLPDVNRAVGVRMHKQDGSTEEDQHYIGRRLQGRGGDNQAGLLMWEVDAHVTAHSVHPFVRTNGSVRRVRTRWNLDAHGNLTQRDDELVASFEGLPTSLPEPHNCPPL